MDGVWKGVTAFVGAIVTAFVGAIVGAFVTEFVTAFVGCASDNETRVSFQRTHHKNDAGKKNAYLGAPPPVLLPHCVDRQPVGNDDQSLLHVGQGRHAREPLLTGWG